MSIDSAVDLDGLTRAGAVVARTLAAMQAAVREGVTTAELDDIAGRTIAQHGAQPAPRLVYGFPGVACTSVNDEAVHGIPGPRRLARGDLVSLDVTVELDGYFADAAITVGVPPLSDEAARLVACAEAAFRKGAAAARAGALVSEIGRAVEREVERRGFRVLREICGHGVGRDIHEDPQIANHAIPGDATRVSDGLVIALEPVISARTRRTRPGADGWTILSADGSLTAHHEHTLVVTRARPIVVTAARA
ncbi:MAG TPA: type I methionyl aminopeptidase [Anaeromyxobacter sp.]|nr:type I methionyl aminopeptidase [Anaeromyxobacter sp.]